MSLSKISHLPENIKVLRKMFSTIDPYARCIERIWATIKQADLEVDLYDDEQAKEIYNLSCSSGGKNLPEDYDHFIEDMKVELGIFICSYIRNCQRQEQGRIFLEDVMVMLGEYLSSDIETNLKSSSPFINALSVLDRRVGKRRLQKIADRGSSVAPK